MFREFVLGRAPFFLNFSETTGYIKDRDVDLELNMCKELGIINDLLWDVNNEGHQASDLKIRIKMKLSNDRNLKTDA